MNISTNLWWSILITLWFTALVLMNMRSIYYWFFRSWGIISCMWKRISTPLLGRQSCSLARSLNVIMCDWTWRKVRSIQEWKVPTSVKELRAFLELANYYRRLVETYSKRTTPMLETLQRYKGSDDEWSSSCPTGHEQAIWGANRSLWLWFKRGLALRKTSNSIWDL